MGRRLDLHQDAAVLRRDDADAPPISRHQRRARAGRARRLGHHRPHLAGRLDRRRQPGRQVPDRARRAAGGLQLLRRAARQSRSDDARHVRQHPPAQPARARHRGRRDAPPARTATQMSIYDAAMQYQAEGVPLVVIAGKEYGTGSSRDWAAKGTMLLGVRAVIAESYERIHRSNLVGMGVLPLQFLPGRDARVARPDRRRDLRRSRGVTAAGAAAQTRRRGDGARRQRAQLQRRRPHRFAGRGRVLPQRRHPADRDPRDRGQLTSGGARWRTRPRSIRFATASTSSRRPRSSSSDAATRADRGVRGPRSGAGEARGRAARAPGRRRAARWRPGAGVVEHAGGVARREHAHAARRPGCWRWSGSSARWPARRAARCSAAMRGGAVLQAHEAAVQAGVAANEEGRQAAVEARRRAVRAMRRSAATPSSTSAALS